MPTRTGREECGRWKKRPLRLDASALTSELKMLRPTSPPAMQRILAPNAPLSDTPATSADGDDTQRKSPRRCGELSPRQVHGPGNRCDCSKKYRQIDRRAVRPRREQIRYEATNCFSRTERDAWRQRSRFGSLNRKRSNQQRRSPLHKPIVRIDDANRMRKVRHTNSDRSPTQASCDSFCEARTSMTDLVTSVPVIGSRSLTRSAWFYGIIKRRRHRRLPRWADGVHVGKRNWPSSSARDRRP